MNDDDNVKLAVFRDMLNNMSAYCHGNNIKAGWWTDVKTGESLVGKRNVGELLCLVHSEISEAMEGYRKNLMDDKLPHREMIEVELADAIIRIFDLAGSMGMDLGGAFEEKIIYNSHREDHKIENRVKENGKKF
jgi:NTP pyrophosphatase (non-canonical NTP hydrolase)